MGSRQKGNVAELEVAKLIEAWWQPASPGCKFVRTPLSGGWGGPQVRAGFKASGDLMTTAQNFPFVVEVKRREAWSWATFSKGQRSPVWGWWRQACEAAEEQGGMPMLWFRQNRRRSFDRPLRKGGIRVLGDEWNVLVEDNNLFDGSCVPWDRDSLLKHGVLVHPICFSAEHVLASDPKMLVVG